MSGSFRRDGILGGLPRHESAVSWESVDAVSFVKTRDEGLCVSSGSAAPNELGADQPNDSSQHTVFFRVSVCEASYRPVVLALALALALFEASNGTSVAIFKLCRSEASRAFQALYR
jgi:hypothetical protein